MVNGRGYNQGTLNSTKSVHVLQKVSIIAFYPNLL